MPCRAVTLLRVAAAAGLAALAGCTATAAAPPGTSSPPDDAGVGDEVGTDDGAVEAAASFPAIAPRPAQVQTSGGEVLAGPRVVPVFFPDQKNGAALEDFIARYVASSTWRQATAEYGVGSAMAGVAVQPEDPLPSPSMSTDDLAAWLESELDGTHPDWGPADPATLATSVFVLFVPPETTLYAPGDDGTNPYAPSLCGPRSWDPTGWHWQTNPAVGHGSPIAFAVVGECSFPRTSLLDSMTATLSHELVEVATDPFFSTAPAYWTVDQAHGFWIEIAGGGEIGDLCLQEQTPFVRPPDVGYLVQRTWSNAAASGGHAPCIPGVAPAYFDVQADAPDWLLDPYVGVVVKGVVIPGNQSRTIDVRLFSDGPTDAWQVRAVDPSAGQGGQALLDLSLDRDSGQNGDVLHLTIRPLFDQSGTTALYEIDSTMHGVTQAWYGEVALK